MMSRYLCTFLLVFTAGATEARAQTTPDSTAIWTSLLGRGTDGERAEALGRLAERAPSSLPAATQQAMIAELRRLSAGLLASPRVAWTDDATGEYYMSLVGAVSSLETIEAYRALVPSIGVSLGIARRVARLGDETVPILRGYISKGYETDVALGTLGLVSFWADSTGAPLSLASRAQILQTFLQAYGSSAHRTRLGLLMGLQYANDPTLLPLARALDAKARAANDVFIVSSLAPVIATLDTRNGGMALVTRLRILLRNVTFLCQTAPAGPGQVYCQSAKSDLDALLKHVEAANGSAARSDLARALKSADSARSKGTITVGEHASIAAEISDIRSRVP